MKYYLISIALANDIFFNGKSLKQLLEEFYPELYKRENERVNILYSVSPLVSLPPEVRKKYEAYVHETSEIYKRLEVPEYLIATGNDKKVIEVCTHNKLVSKYDAALGIRSTTIDKTQKFFDSIDYNKCVSDFFKVITGEIVREVQISNKDKTSIELIEEAKNKLAKVLKM